MLKELDYVLQPTTEATESAGAKVGAQTPAQRFLKEFQVSRDTNFVTLVENNLYFTETKYIFVTCHCPRT